MRNTAILLAVLAMLLAPSGLGPWPGAARAASYDCGKATAPTDVAICANPTLSGLDSQMGAAYSQRLARDPTTLQTQRAWLRARSTGCGHDVPCLRNFLTYQLSWLEGRARMPASLPGQPGACSLTTVSRLGSRLEGDPSSGSAIEEANGAMQISYDVVAGIRSARLGDPILVCLVSLPTNCPPGDDRGKFYAAADLRTLAAWTAPDAEHGCGGA